MKTYNYSLYLFINADKDNKDLVGLWPSYQAQGKTLWKVYKFLMTGEFSKRNGRSHSSACLCNVSGITIHLPFRMTLSITATSS